MVTGAGMVMVMVEGFLTMAITGSVLTRCWNS
jgi:hypothetical protein